MSLAQTAEKLRAILRRDLLTAIRYRTGFAITAAGTLVELAAFYYLARAIGPDFRPNGVAYFPFLLVGTGLYTFLVMGMGAFVRVVQDAQQTGTLEVLMTCSTPAPTVVMLSAASVLAGNMLQLFFYVGLGMFLFGVPLHGASLFASLIVLGLSVVIVIALGMVAAALQIAIQKGSAVLWLFGSGAWFLTGTLFPIETLPKPLQWVSAAIPLTHSLRAMRMALLQGSSLSALAPDVSFLALSSLVLLPVGLLTFSFCLQRARRQGTLSFF
jgi:ABC-2 type transport system permease protein